MTVRTMQTPVRITLFVGLVAVASLFNSTAFYSLGLIEANTPRIVISVILGALIAYPVVDSLTAKQQENGGN